MSTSSMRSWEIAREKMTGESGRKYTIYKKIEGGAYGIFKVKTADGSSYAMKDEAYPGLKHRELLLEVQILNQAKQNPEWEQRFPRLVDQGRQDARMFIVMTLLGESLADIKRRQPDRIFSPNTALYCALQTLEAIRCLHNMGFIHRDIKPENICIGSASSGNWNKIYLIDFGIARKFVDDNGRLVRAGRKPPFLGTPKFATLASSKRKELGRKDDIESWLYTIVDLMREDEELPWHESHDGRTMNEKKRMQWPIPTNYSMPNILNSVTSADI